MVTVKPTLHILECDAKYAMGMSFQQRSQFSCSCSC
jgi:hypothetical protein